MFQLMRISVAYVVVAGTLNAASKQELLNAYGDIAGVLRSWEPTENVRQKMDVVIMATEEAIDNAEAIV